MLISEPTGLYILPLAMNLARNAYNLIDELNLYLVPFTIMIIYQFFSARAQGQDEGSPAVLALKKVEATGIGMLFVAITFTQPWDSKPNFRFSQYSCSSNASLISADFDTKDITGSNRFAGLGNDIANLPIITGVVHDFAAAVNGTLIAKMPCMQGVNVNEVTDDLTAMIPKEEVLLESIKAFNNQCYIPALANVKSEQQKGNPLKYIDSADQATSGLPDNQNQVFRFFSTFMLNAYQGDIANERGSGASTINPNLTIATGENWYNTSQRNSKLMCSSVANSLKDEIKQDLYSDSDYANKRKKIKNFVSLYYPATDSDIDNEMISVMFQNVVSSITGSRETSFKEARQFATSEFLAQSFPNLEKSGQYIMNAGGDVDRAGKGFIDSLIFFGGMYKSVEETAKAHAAQLVMPSMVIVALAIIIASIPVISLLSGYSIQVMYQILLFYFGISLVPYWLNVGIMFQTMLSALVPDGPLSNNFFALVVVGHYIIYMTPLIWLFLFQVLGTMAGSLLVNALGASTGMGDQAYKQFQSFVDQAKRTVGKFASGKGGNGADDPDWTSKNQKNLF